MPPKNTKKGPAKGKKTPRASSTTTTTNQHSARHLSREARGEPHDVGKLKNALAKRRSRAKKRTQASPAWQAATPEEREGMENAASAAVMAGQPDFRALGAAAGTRMGRGYGGWKGKGMGGEVERGEGERGEDDDDDDDDEEMEDLPIDGPDDTPGYWGRRGEDDDEEGGGGAGAKLPAPDGFD